MSVEIIAEIGVNHNRDAQLASRLIIKVMEAGADTAKFQHSTVREMTSKLEAPRHYAYIESLVPDLAFIRECKEECKLQGIKFLCTPDGEESFEQLLDIGVGRVKIGSDNLLNFRLLERVARWGGPVILSTGLHDMRDVRQGLGYFTGPFYNNDLTLLHCTSLYPAPVETANLRAMQRMKAAFINVQRVGWSDHTESLTLPAVAVALGAEVIEKHITFDSEAEGPDHKASLEPHQFKLMVEFIREAEAAMGTGAKVPTDAEHEAYKTIGKSLVATRDIRQGEPFSLDRLAVKRPGTGIHPSAMNILIGKHAHRAYAEDELIDRKEIDR